MTVGTAIFDEHSGIDAFLADYRPRAQGRDEMVDATGRPRPHWRAFLAKLADLGPDALATSFAAADRHLKESGVFYRVYDDPKAGERPWPLSHIPVIISADDWEIIRTGIVERAELIEAVLADCFGAARLVSDGTLPAAAIAGSPDFLRPLAGVAPVGGRHLQVYAADLARGLDGRWHVIRDRTQAPSGAGYAIENRIALSRALSETYRAFDIHRLAPFFDEMRTSLAALSEPGDAGVCLLTPGPLNETYFEHTYLARYLGLRLVEGVDLTVRGDELYLRTVAGLRRVNALLRRVDGPYTDPLELNPRSRLGVPGLMHVVRAGRVAIANALGSGLAETPALTSLMPALASKVIGRDLILPDPPAWWCGEPEAREHVLGHLDQLVLQSAFAGPVDGLPESGFATPRTLPPADRDALSAAIHRRGIDFVAGTPLAASTTPVWSNGRLEPHPFSLRVFAAATANGFVVMPGGFALIGDRSDPQGISMQRGARSADVWVLSNAPVVAKTLLPPEGEIAIRRATGALPSRAADNLFWHARYLERTDATLRLIRALSTRLAERRDPTGKDTTGLALLLYRWGAADAPHGAQDLRRVAATALYNETLPGAVHALVHDARRTAFVIRDRFPADAWLALEELHTYSRTLAGPVPAEGPIHEKASVALRLIAALAGFQINMNRLTGWRFLEIGAAIERAISMCRYVRQFSLSADSTPGELDLLLELADTRITYRVRYPFGLARAPVLDLVLLDDSNPRSLAFQIARIEEHVDALPRAAGAAQPLRASSARLFEAARALDATRLGASDILTVESGLMRLATDIADSFFTSRLEEPEDAQ